LLNLFFKKMDNRVVSVVVAPTDSFGEIKRRLEPLVDITSTRIRLICQGRAIDDDLTPVTLDIPHESMVHIVLSSVNLRDKMSKDRLRANCRVCHTAGVQFEPRPLCARCGYEGVMWTGNIPVIAKTADLTGASSFGDLANWKISCPVCGDAEDDQMPAAVGFLCVTQKPFLCSGRHASGRSRLQFVYKPAVEGQPPTPSLQDRLVQLFSYAHGGGFEMDPTAALAEEAAAGAGAAAGAHA